MVTWAAFHWPALMLMEGRVCVFVVPYIYISESRLRPQWLLMRQQVNVSQLQETHGWIFNDWMQLIALQGHQQRQQAPPPLLYLRWPHARGGAYWSWSPHRGDKVYYTAGRPLIAGSAVWFPTPEGWNSNMHEKLAAISVWMSSLDNRSIQSVQFLCSEHFAFDLMKPHKRDVEILHWIRRNSQFRSAFVGRVAPPARLSNNNSGDISVLIRAQLDGNHLTSVLFPDWSEL